ncbi:MAG: F0F1 ATP synthase subunit B [Actinomycetota bacterium]
MRTIQFAADQLAALELAAGEELNPLIPHTSEIIVGFVAFSLLYIVLRRAVVPKFEKAFADRTDAIQGGMERAEKAQREAEAALTQYKSQLSDARGEAQQIREEARVQGAAIIDEMRAKAQEEAARITSSAQAAIEAERQQAINSLRSEVGTLATELASKIVGEALDDQVRQSRIVDRFLADLEKQK